MSEVEFFEADEPIERILAFWESAPKGVTAPPADTVGGESDDLEFGTSRPGVSRAIEPATVGHAAA